MTVDGQGSIRIAAVGDLLLACEPNGSYSPRDSAAIFAGVRRLLSQCVIVFGNLECTLVGDGATVATEPRVVSAPELVNGIKTAGFTVVSLGNNHMFDCLEVGFHRLQALLDELGIAYFGAGDNLAEAAAPTILKKAGIRIAFIAGVDERSGPSHFATETHWGVAPLDVIRMTKQIHELRDRVDHVIVSVHWGEERFLIPSPVQIEQAHAFVDAGASMVLGHHPHVLQGLEMYRGTPIIYSLGNFVTNDVHFTNGDIMKWNHTERTGCILLADLNKTNSGNVRQVPTYDSGQRVCIDRTGFGGRRIDRVNLAVSEGVSLKRYRLEHLLVKTIKPVLQHLRWSQLRRLRPAHVRNALVKAARAFKAN